MMIGKRPCSWCHAGNKPLMKSEIAWGVVDDDAGQFVHLRAVQYCFACGRKLEEKKEEKK